MAARIRAARAYAGLEQAKLAQRLEMGLATYKRLEAAERPASKPELIRIAQVCGVPIDFMEQGWRYAVLDNDDLLVRRIFEDIGEIKSMLRSRGSYGERLRQAVIAQRVANQRLAALRDLMAEEDEPDAAEEMDGALHEPLADEDRVAEWPPPKGRRIRPGDH